MKEQIFFKIMRTAHGEWRHVHQNRQEYNSMLYNPLTSKKLGPSVKTVK